MNKKIIIAVDGVSASGKGSVCKLIASEYNLAYLDTGLLYRYVGYNVLKNHIEFSNIEGIVNIAKNLALSEINHINLNNEQIARAASIVASITEVRAELRSVQQNFANQQPEKNGAILDGRDIGTVICPNADLKFFITADLTIRASRRYQQIKTSNANITLAEILENIRNRDNQDFNLNELARNNKDCIVIDNSELSLEQTFSLMQQYITPIIS